MFQTNCYECLQGKESCPVLNILFEDQKLTIMLFGGDGTYRFVQTKMKNHLLLQFFHSETQATTTEHLPKKAKTFPGLS